MGAWNANHRLVLTASPRSGRRREKFVVASAVFIGSDGIRAPAKPLRNSSADPGDIKTCHAEGENELVETAKALETQWGRLKGRWGPYIP